MKKIKILKMFFYLLNMFYFFLKILFFLFLIFALCLNILFYKDMFNDKENYSRDSFSRKK